MLDAKRLLDAFFSAGPAEGRPAGAAAPPGSFGILSGRGVLAGGLSGLLLRSKARRRFGAATLKMGGLALLSALAYKAHWDWKAGRRPSLLAPGAAAPPLALPPAGTPFNLPLEPDQQRLARMLVRAMIMAAKADGEIDRADHAKLMAEIGRLELDKDDHVFLLEELKKPFDVDFIGRSARTEVEAVQVYVASLVASDVDSAPDRGYLALLVPRLKLDEKLVQHLHATVDSAVIGKAA
jgi:uncharacterized membrane protein YebE (DUF533 family)